MGYCNRNLLQKIIDIQTIYLEHKANGVVGEFIFHRYIKPVYRISRGTFYNYLRRNAKKELKDLNKTPQGY